jgi:hypothetical protein
VSVAAQQAVNDELARVQARANILVAAPAASANGHDRPAPPGESPGHRNGSGSQTNGPAARAGDARGRLTKPATPGQVKALFAFARAQHADLEGLIRDEYGVGRPQDLSLPQASTFIDQPKAIGAS